MYMDPKNIFWGSKIEILKEKWDKSSAKLWDFDFFKIRIQRCRKPQNHFFRAKIQIFFYQILILH